MSRPEHQLARITSLTVYIPGEKPAKYSEKQVMAAGMQEGTAVARVVEEDGGVIDYYGLPMKVVKAAPSGLVVPSGPLLVPPNS